MSGHYRVPQRTAALATSIPCPGCGAGSILIHRSCLTTSFSCSSCPARFQLGDLARQLDDSDFASLEFLIDDRLSDRV